MSFNCYRQFIGSIALTMCDMIETLFDNYDTFEAYGVSEYISSAALTVARDYRGRGIGDHILVSRLDSDFTIIL